MPFLLKGWASTPERDAEDHLVTLGAFDLSRSLPPLFYDHRDDAVAGRILSLEWKPEGLWIECIADDQYANLPAFSVRFQVKQHEVVGTGRNAHARVLKAALREISLVSRPCCKSALVVSRELHSPIDFAPLLKAQNDCFDVLIQHMRLMSRMLETLKG